MTLDGISALANPMQFWNAELPMLVTPSGIVTPVSPLQPEKERSPILVTLAGIAKDPVLFAGYTMRMVFNLLKSTPSALLNFRLAASTELEFSPLPPSHE